MPAEKSLPKDWKNENLQIKRKDTYTGEQLRNIAFPIGGIGTGFLALSGRGELVEWQIFNNVNKRARVPDSGFALLLKSEGGFQTIPLQQFDAAKNGFEDVTFTGEYPVGTLQLSDAKIPVGARVTVWNPFVPLDARSSSYPAAVFEITLKNKSNNPVNGVLLGSMMNCIGYDGQADLQRSSAAFLAGNTIEPIVSKNSTALLFQSGKYQRSRLSERVSMLVVGNTPVLEAKNIPQELDLDFAPGVNAESLSKYQIIFVNENADLPDAATVEKLLEWVRRGGNLILSERGFGWVDASRAGVFNTFKEPSRTVTFASFENRDYKDWTPTGSAFGRGPATGAISWQNPVSGWTGRSFVNSFQPDDAPRGTLTSPEFTIDRNYIHLLVGGGNFEKKTCVNLLIDGKSVATATGDNTEKLLQVHWDVRAWKGKKATIQAVDDASAGWGHILLDHIQFSDSPRNERIMDKEASHALMSLFEEPIDNTLKIARDLEDRSTHTAFFGIFAKYTNIQYISTTGLESSDRNFGSMAFACLDPKVKYYISEYGLPAAGSIITNETLQKPPVRNAPAFGNLQREFDLPPGAEIKVSFILTWHFPNRAIGNSAVGNQYTHFWKDAGAAAAELIDHFGALEKSTKQFAELLYGSTIPWPLLDAAGSQACIVRSPTMLWLGDGNIAGWEGLNERDGCCPMNCSHVYNYVQTVAKLFPELERNVRKLDLKHQQNANGGVNNRIAVPIGAKPSGEPPFADGHVGTILKSYREHLNSADDSFLHENWLNIKKALDYAIVELDRDEDGVFEGAQWNTYDQVVTGVNTFVGTLYLAALRSGEEMAKRMNEPELAARYRKIYNTGAARYAETGWNGEYFEQKGGHEFGAGCLSDQLLGEWWAQILNLGSLLPEEKIKKTLESIYKYNFLPDFSNFEHSQRVFANGTDRGLLNCAWPRGGRPARPILYCDEAWTGVEYAVASLMIYHGMHDEALTLVRAARDRYDGKKRNPWNEIECGDQYSRAMSSWSLLLAAQNVFVDGPRGFVRFEPKFGAENHKSLLTGPEGWGYFEQIVKPAELSAEIVILKGTFHIQSLEFGPAGANAGKKARASLGTKERNCEIQFLPSKAVRFTFPEPLTVSPGAPLRASFI
ncbi:MAG: GH116 family glycosyl hydrolase [Planctomycetota bacterium]